jgi:predicted Zn-dependent protease
MKNSLYIGIFFLAAAILSCESMGSVTGLGAQIARGAGLINENVADAITQSGEALGKALEEITPEQEYYIGRAVAANILTTYKVYTGEPALTAYVNKICNAITINSDRPEIFNGYHVNILDSAEINAFATSGGHIFVTRGLIECTDSEDALAGVIAHEIAHIQLQHSLKAIKNSRINQALMVTGVSAAGAAADMDVKELTSVFNESVSEILNTLINNGYSQTQEFDADSAALSLMASAGYEPSSLVAMLHSLESSQPGRPGGFNKTHPSPAQRITKAEGLLGKYKVSDTRSYRTARFAAGK